MAKFDSLAALLGLSTTPAECVTTLCVPTWYCQGFSGSRLVTLTVSRTTRCEALSDFGDLLTQRRLLNRVTLVKSDPDGRECTEVVQDV